MAATPTQIIDPAVGWAGVILPFLAALVAAGVAYLKRNDPLVPPAPPPVTITPAPVNVQPAVEAVTAANAQWLAMYERHMAKADEQVTTLSRENGELRRENGELREGRAEDRRRLAVMETQLLNANSKIEVLETRLHAERERRG